MNRHNLVYDMHSTKISWCKKCNKHFYGSDVKNDNGIKYHELDLYEEIDQNQYFVDFWGSNGNLFCIKDVVSNRIIGGAIRDKKTAIEICKWYNELNNK